MSEENENVPWSQNSRLNWSDFKAEPNPAAFEDAHSVIKYHFTWTVNSEKIGDHISFFIENLQIVPEFHPVLSWVRKLEANESLLKHEQGHFDLAELVKRENLEKFKEMFYEKHYLTRGKNQEQRKQFAKDDSGKMLSLEIEKLEQILSQKRLDYDEQTEFGQNSQKQLEYDKLFESLR